MLEIKNLKVVRGSFNVVLPELFIDDGECVALCGISGSGKSTLMEALGLLTPALSVEEFVLDDIEVDMLSSRDAQALRINGIGIMPQTGGLLPYLTIEENLRLQISLALRQQVTPVFKHPRQSKPSPNTRVVLQEAEEHAAARRAAREASTEKAVEAAISGASAAARAVSLQGEKLSGESALTLTSQAISGAGGTAISGAQGANMGTAGAYAPGHTQDQNSGDRGDAAGHSWLDRLNDERSELDGRHAYAGTYEQLSNPHDQINARTGTVPEAVRKESRIPYIKGDDRYSRTLKIDNQSNSIQIEHYLRALLPHIERLQLTDHLHKRPDQLSIGQRQRALFLRAIAHKPRLLLIDEPTSSLDPDNAGTLFELIDEIAQQTRVSVLLVTHDLTAASRYRRYVYDRKASHSNYSIFVDASDEPKHDMSTAGSDGQFMSGQAIDFPAASNLSQKVHGGKDGAFDENMRNQVYRSEEKGFHEIRTSVSQGRGGDIVDELYRGYGGTYDQFSLNGHHHGTGSYDSDSYAGADDPLAGFGGRRQINERVTHYTTSLERLQVRLKSHNAARDVQGSVLSDAGARLYTGAPVLNSAELTGRSPDVQITEPAAMAAGENLSGTAMTGSSAGGDISTYAGASGVGGSDGGVSADHLQGLPYGAADAPAATAVAVAGAAAGAAVGAAGTAVGAAGAAVGAAGTAGAAVGNNEQTGGRG